MRIVGGKYKGRTLVVFDGNAVRPTSDKVRESLFNILQFDIAGACFLDLFCGTGAMGIEALSRGAKSVTFNDASKDSLKILSKNLQKVGVANGYEISNRDAIGFLESTSAKYDIVYIDPPYATDLGERAVEIVSRALNADGIVILEGEKDFDGEISGLIKYDQRKYGRARLTFFKKGE